MDVSPCFDALKLFNRLRSTTRDPTAADGASHLWRESQEMGKEIFPARFDYYAFSFNFLGQHLDDEASEELEKLPPNPNLYQLLFIKYRKFTAMMMPILFFHVSFFQQKLTREKPSVPLVVRRHQTQLLSMVSRVLAHACYDDSRLLCWRYRNLA